MQKNKLSEDELLKTSGEMLDEFIDESGEVTYMCREDEGRSA